MSRPGKREMTEEEFVRRQVAKEQEFNNGKLVPSNPLPEFFQQTNKRSIRRAKRHRQIKKPS